MKEPWFWRDDGYAAKAASALMAPASMLYDAAQRLRMSAATPQKSGAPVICVGNATLGGAGKTPFALMLKKILGEKNIKVHFASRGFGGNLKGPVRVSADHTAIEVGDEPLLLAAEAPTWIAKNRLDGVRAAAKGADIVIMDDGFQNPTVAKDFAILLADADDPCGNGRVFPAGPMREPFARAAARADAIALIGEGDGVPVDVAPVFRARRRMTTDLAPQKIFAFCGIARAERFFSGLEAAGFTLAGARAFADHHPYAAEEISALMALAKKAGAQLMTTEKDFVRLPADARSGVNFARLELTIDDAGGLYDLIAKKIGTPL